jgi:hypothetical protein
MNTYNVQYISYGSCGNSNVNAASASDAKAITETSGVNRGCTVYKVSGPEGTIEFMSYSAAIEIQRNRK